MKELNGRLERRINLGNSDMIRASEDGVIINTRDVDAVRIQIGPELDDVRLADGSRTVITDRLHEYIAHNGDWEVVE